MRASFLMDFNGTLDSTHLLTPIKGLWRRIYSKLLNYAPKYDGDISAGGVDPAFLERIPLR